MPWIAGVDGCKAGWVAAFLQSDSGEVRFEVLPSFARIVSSAYRPRIIAVDMPIGLPSTSSPRRACDTEARGRLGPRRSSIFSPPVRDVAGIAVYGEANETSKRLTGRGLSKQAFHIMPKIREVEASLLAKPSCDIRECHPEVSFMAMNGDVPLAAYKRKPEGQRLRRTLLDREFGKGFAKLEAAFSGVALDDVHDAFACLWTARRILQGIASSLPPTPPRDALGLLAQIVF